MAHVPPPGANGQAATGSAVLEPGPPQRTGAIDLELVTERLNQQVAAWLHQKSAPLGTGVLIEAEELCMTLRGAAAAGATTLTSAVLGHRRDDPHSRQEFFHFAGLPGRDRMRASGR
jgi:GTP cyclohydrolase I